MQRFIITTEEIAEGRYLVDAVDEDQARKKIHGPPIDWDGVEQLDYMASIVEVEKVVQVPLPGEDEDDDGPTGGVREPRRPSPRPPRTSARAAMLECGEGGS